jgi:DNA-directed RNA polymerase subunit L|tara:strand:+ start:113 stop:1294 length:1182 start_codon:yes stop_codon:yes gene_type:complete
MKFKNFIKKDNKIIFDIKDVDLSIMNSIRRTILVDIPNIAFDYQPYDFDEKKIEIIKNTCSLHNEIILQRLSMIPLKFDENEIYNFKPTKYKFQLKKMNNSNKMMNVTTEHIEIYDENDKKYDDKFIRKIFPKNKLSGDFILITKLKPNMFDKSNGDVLEIKMIASTKTAKEYAGFGYVSQCVFFNVIDEKLAKEELSKRLDNSKLSKKELDNLEKEFNTLDKYRYFKKNEYDEPNYFNFQIESETRTSPEFLFFKAIVILKNRIENLISNIIDGNIKIEKVDKSKNLYSFEINNEKHTLGNLIQSLFYNEFIRNNKGKIIEFIGYNCPHPLEELLIIKIKFNEIIKEEEINNIFIEGLVKIQTEIENINNSWIKTSNLNTKLIEVDDFLNES